ncbi:MAG: acyl carrier protein [Deltaproteobacteria bacterium]|nr:acyl carrier protein [Deltaproteobacteria bacterium]
MAKLPANVDPALFEKVQRCFCEALELEPYEVQWGSRILADLDAESLDLLDVVFRLEQAFAIQIPRGGLENQAKEVDGEPGEVDGKLTAPGARRLQELMPEVPPDEIFEGLKAVQIPELFRVGTFYNIVVALQEAQSAE